MAVVEPSPQLATSTDGEVSPLGELPGESLNPGGTAAPMRQHSFASEGGDFDADISPDGTTLVFASTRHAERPDLYLKRIDGAAVTQLTADPDADLQPCFSPDGKSVIFASRRSGNWDLWMTGLTGGQAVQITSSPQHELHPSFVPDGKRIAYCAYNPRGGTWELWTLQLDQPGSRRMIGDGLFPEWSPRTDSILYQRARQRGGHWYSVWRIDLEMGEPRFPVELASRSDMALIQPSWSPDGEWITFGSASEPITTAGFGENPASETTLGDIWIMRADGTSPQRLTNGTGTSFGPVWAPDGNVYFSSRQHGIENLWSILPVVGREALTAQPAPRETTAAAMERIPVRGG